MRIRLAAVSLVLTAASDAAPEPAPARARDLREILRRHLRLAPEAARD